MKPIRERERKRLTERTMSDDETPEVSVSDRRRLVHQEGEQEQEQEHQEPQEPQDQEQSPPPAPLPFHRRHRWCLLVSLALLAIAIGHAIAVYFIYFQCHKFNG